MHRLSRHFVLIAIVLITCPANAAEPSPIEKQLAVQKAMATARQFLELRMPDDAILALEAEIAKADGNKAFLTLLREAYLAQLYRLENSTEPDAAKVEKVPEETWRSWRRGAGLEAGDQAREGGASTPRGRTDTRHCKNARCISCRTSAGTPAPSPIPLTNPFGKEIEAPPQPAAANTAHEAAEAFKKGNYEEGRRLYAAAAASPAKLTAQQSAAWAYCRIRLAAEKGEFPEVQRRGRRRDRRGCHGGPQARSPPRGVAEGGGDDHRDRQATAEIQSRFRGGEQRRCRRDRELPRAPQRQQHAGQRGCQGGGDEPEGDLPALERAALGRLDREVRDRDSSHRGGLHEGNRPPGGEHRDLEGETEQPTCHRTADRFASRRRGDHLECTAARADSRGPRRPLPGPARRRSGPWRGWRSSRATRRKCSGTRGRCRAAPATASGSRLLNSWR